MDNKQLSFEETLDALLDASQTLKPNFLYRLSNLSPKDTAALAKNWMELPLERRRALLDDLETFADADPLLSFEAVARLGLRDEDPQVRLTSIRILWEDETETYADTLLDFLESDENEEVRAGAASALGNYVYLGWVEEFSEQKLKVIEARLLDVIRSTEPPLIRRRALEAMGFSCLPEMSGVIEEAFSTDDEDWQVSSLFAMGRSADTRWASDILEMLPNHSPAIRLEAARAAGELEIEDARPDLLRMLDDPDDGVRLAVIWSLSQIGGSDVEAALSTLLEETIDEEARTQIEEALDNIAFFGGLDDMNLFDLDEDSLHGMIHEIEDED